MKRFLKKLIRALLCFWVFLFILVPNVRADTLQGWALVNGFEEYTDVNLGPCNAGSCSFGSISLSPSYFYDSGSLVQYGYFTTSSHKLGTYGDMILNFRRYKSGYLYQHQSAICLTSNVTISNVDLYVGSYNDTINKVGNLSYHNILIQTLNNHPFSPGDQVYRCYLLVDLFVPNVDGQNLGTVITGTANTNTGVWLIGDKYESLGVWTNSLSSQIQSIINNSGLATANSVASVQSSLNNVQQEVTEVNSGISDLNDTINDDDISGTNSFIDDLLDDDTFDDNSGIQNIINSPLNFIRNLNNTCSPISLSIPFINTSLSIPCIKQELTTRVPSVVNILSVAINGFVIYRILLDIVRIIKNAKNPDDDRIEVLDL